MKILPALTLALELWFSCINALEEEASFHIPPPVFLRLILPVFLPSRGAGGGNILAAVAPRIHHSAHHSLVPPIVSQSTTGRLTDWMGWGYPM